MSLTRPSASACSGLRRALLAWYARARRDLPWRATRDPYAIWISEAMLQQTRVETVAGYWRRFVTALPDVRALAEASEERVLALWSGLGYYRRARCLQAAARALVERHGGHFPRTAEELLALPGIGPYTAGAVLSIAFDVPAALVDGNVARVLTRLFALERDAGSAAARRELWELAALLLPRRGAGDWNQALMELGATVCTPRAPRCGECPWQRRCLARSAGRELELPRARARPAAVDVALSIARAERGGRLLLQQRPAQGRMAGLWEFPTREEPAADGTPSGLFPAQFDWPMVLREAVPLGDFTHAITRHRIRAQVFAARPVGPRPRSAVGLQWIARERLADLALTGMAAKVLALGPGEACAGAVKVR